MKKIRKKWKPKGRWEVRVLLASELLVRTSYHVLRQNELKKGGRRKKKNAGLFFFRLIVVIHIIIVDTDNNSF